MKLSATIITLNEEKHIARAIKSVSFADEIIVLDSFSTDKTVEIAKSLGAKVISDKFEGYGQHKNLAEKWANGEWILSIDADEEVTPELKKEILQVIESGQAKAYQLNRRTSFCGKWIYNGGWYPDKLTRLYKKNEAKWTEPKVHEELKVLDGSQTPLLKGHLNHYSFPSVESQIETNIKYAKLGSRQLIEKKGRKPYFFEVLFRPLGKFIECYFIKMGLLDGREGLIIALNASYSLFMKYIFAYSDKSSD